MIAAAITLNQKGVRRASILGGIMNGGMLALSGLMLLGWKPEIVEAGQTALPNSSSATPSAGIGSSSATPCCCSARSYPPASRSSTR